MLHFLTAMLAAETVLSNNRDDRMMSWIGKDMEERGTDLM
jgi:hypothetical protein